MIIPKFEDICKRSNKIVTGIYEPATLCVKVKSKHGSNKWALNSALQEDKWQVMLDSKAKAHHGVEIVQKCSTATGFSGELALCDCLFKGSRFGLMGSFVPQTGQLNTALSANVIRKNVRLDLALVKEASNEPIKWTGTGLVVAVKECLIGCQLVGPPYESKSWTENCTIGLSYATKDFEASLLRVRNHNWVMTLGRAIGVTETVVRLTLDEKSKQSELELAAKLKCTANANNALLLKMDHKANLCLAVSTQLGPYIIAKVWGQVGEMSKKGNYMDRCKMGLGLQFEF